MKIPGRFAFVLAVSVPLTVALSCHNNHAVDMASIRNESDPGKDHIAELTLIDGREIKFDGDSRPLLRNDTIRGEVHKISIAIPADSVQRVWLRTIDPVRTTLAVIGTVVGIAGVISAVAIATKQSCPFIYSWDGSRYVFDAEPYGGAITRGLERDDYSELSSLANDHGLYRLLVTNEVNETQYTNRLQLLVIDHEAGVAVKANEFGHFYGFTTLRAPTAAHDVDGHDLLPWLAATDHAVWEPVVPPTRNHGARQEITLTFARPGAATSAYLVARVSTGLWGSQMIRQFSQLRGTALRDWYAAIDTNVAAAAALHQWNLREELYALKLFVEEPQGWVDRGVLPGGGPFLATDRVVKLDLRRVQGDSLRIRIRPPYGFWALNSFAIAYDTAPGIRVREVEARVARTNTGADILPDLAASDERYYGMPSTADYATITFPAPALAAGKTRTVFVHARGFYRLHLDPVDAPDSVMLARFVKVPDAAATFAADRYTATRPRSAAAH
ncbi:MAG: hypothetical protein H0U66_03055 [Gemmatimonadaceae bacterium]|nr:hypothetical protein [Gemmatimonadaceae bacterium]